MKNYKNMFEEMKCLYFYVIGCITFCFGSEDEIYHNSFVSTFHALNLRYVELPQCASYLVYYWGMNVHFYNFYWAAFRFLKNLTLLDYLPCYIVKID
jgi:hypothetical protein